MVEVFEDAWSPELPIFEAVFPGDSAYEAGWYPLTGLKHLGQSRQCELASTTMQNEWLKLTLCNELFGRFVEVFDRRTQTQLLTREPEEVHIGDRGDALAIGITFGASQGSGRDLANGFVHVQPAFDDEDPCTVQFGGIWPGTRLRCSMTVQVPSDTAEIRLRVSVYNGGDVSATVQPGLMIHHGKVVRPNLIQVRNGFFGVLSGLFPASAESTGWISTTDPCQLLSGESITSEFTLLPISGMREVIAFGASGAIGRNDEEIIFQPSQVTKGKIVISPSSGGLLEAVVNAQPGNAWTADISAVGSIDAVVLLDEHRNVLIRATDEVPIRFSGPSSAQMPLHLGLAHTLHPCTRHAAWRSLACESLMAHDWQSAFDRFEKSLLFNAENVLAWWGQAYAARMGNIPDAEQLVANAHFLAPLEPMLRAEAYLAMSQEQGAEPSALLKPFADSPEQFMECASTLYELGQWKEMARFIDEALRHIDFPMLRYLLAATLLRESRMATEAAYQVQLAGKAGHAPPYPHRKVEWQALRELHSRFPDDPGVRRFLEFAPSS
jgi:hypothetical protein